MFTEKSLARLRFTLKNPVASRVAKLTAKGLRANQVADKLSLSTESVAAFKAHITRGTYPELDECVY